MLIPHIHPGVLRQLNIHADNIHQWQNLCQPFWQCTIGFQHDFTLNHRQQLLQKSSLQQRLAPSKANCLMRQLQKELIYIGSSFIGIQRIDNLPKASGPRSNLHIAHKMRPTFIFRITVTTVKITALKSHKKLTTAYIATLSLHRGKDFNNICLHSPPHSE